MPLKSTGENFVFSYTGIVFSYTGIVFSYTGTAQKLYRQMLQVLQVSPIADKDALMTKV